MAAAKYIRRFAPAIALTIAAVAVSGVPAAAADIAFHPELVDRLATLKPIYPLQGPASILGDDQPLAMQAEANTQYDALDDRKRQPTAIRISGQIEKGDGETLKKLIETAPGFIDGIVFDSPGGNFLEGFRIAEAIRYSLESQDPNVAGVYVLNGEKCLSACAIAFALAVDLAHPGVPDTRYIEVGAELGFHMGLLPPEKADQTGRVGDILNLSYDITAAFNQLLLGGANPPRLLAKALEHRTPDSFYRLTGGINSWYMGFTPVSNGLLAAPSYLYGFDLDAAARVCTAYLEAGRAYRAEAEEEFSIFFGGREEAGTLLSDLAGEAGSPHLGRGTSGGFSCQYEVRDDAVTRISLWRGDRNCSAGASDDIETWCAVEKRATATVTVGLLADALGCAGGSYLKGAEWNGFKRAGSIKREVNLRAEPSLKGAVVAGLEPGTGVSVTDCAVVDDVQGVWYQIAAGGRNGWVSARFVAEETWPYLPIDR